MAHVYDFYKPDLASEYPVCFFLQSFAYASYMTWCLVSNSYLQKGLLLSYGLIKMLSIYLAQAFLSYGLIKMLSIYLVHMPNMLLLIMVLLLMFFSIVYSHICFLFPVLHFPHKLIKWSFFFFLKIDETFYWIRFLLCTLKFQVHYL